MSNSTKFGRAALAILAARGELRSDELLTELNRELAAQRTVGFLNYRMSQLERRGWIVTKKVGRRNGIQRQSATLYALTEIGRLRIDIAE